jgi:hypothetical protein
MVAVAWVLGRLGSMMSLRVKGRQLNGVVAMSGCPPIASAQRRSAADVVGQNRPSRALSEPQEIRVKFNGELPAGRAEVPWRKSGTIPPRWQRFLIPA